MEVWIALVKNRFRISRIRRAFSQEIANESVLELQYQGRKDMPERRRFKRTRTLMAAKIFFDGCETLINCVVCDLSIGGAGIRTANTADIPDEFDLTFDAARTLRACRVAWRSESRIGVAF